MAIPTTREGLIDAIYVYNGDGKCRGCGATVEWWETPKGKKMPFDEKNGRYTPHWGTCPERGQFANKKESAKSGDSFQRPVQTGTSGRSAAGVSQVRSEGAQAARQQVPDLGPTPAPEIDRFENGLRWLNDEYRRALARGSAENEELRRTVHEMDNILVREGYFDANKTVVTWAVQWMKIKTILDLK